MASLDGPLALSPDVLVIPVADLPEESRAKLDCGPGDVAVSRPQGRSGSKILDADAARLLERFRQPRTVVEAVILYGREKQVEPDQVLEGAFPLLRSLVDGGFLVAAEASAAERPGGASLAAGAPVPGGTVARVLQVLDDTEVHLVSHPDGGQSVLKVERAAGTSVRGRLRREAACLAHLDGAIAPRLLGQGELEGRAYVEVELVLGSDVGAAAVEWRERGGAAGRAGLLSLARGLAEAYAALHERGVLHGDVHPRNALVERDGRVRLIDFGLASGAPGGALPAPAERGGVPFFYEPELARASLAGALSPATPAGEQHAVAALVYHLATGAYWQDFRLTRQEMLEDLATLRPLPFRDRGLEPWPDLEAVLQRALAKEPGDRFPSMRAFCEALAGVVTPPALRRTAGPVPSLARSVEQALGAADFDGPWMRQGLSPAPTCSINYGEAGVIVPAPEYALGSRQLVKGMTGSDVKAMQELLLQLGCSLPKYGADADFGAETERAVIAFQKKQGLTADGKYGEETHKAAMAALADSEDGKQDEPSAEEPAPDELPAADGTQVKIVAESGKVNVRVGNGTEYSRISSVAGGSTFSFVATAANGWHAIVINGQVGWVSGKYSQIV